MTGTAIVRRYVEAVQRFDEAAAFDLLHPRMRFHELPNRIRPKGGVDDVEAMRVGFRRAAEGKVLRAQRYILGEVMEAGDRVVVEARWEGDLVVPVGKLQAGDMLVAHLCMVFRLADGLIIEQRNYDCYEDFTAAASPAQAGSRAARAYPASQLCPRPGAAGDVCEVGVLAPWVMNLLA